jgi:hypothetical protein
MGEAPRERLLVQQVLSPAATQGTTMISSAKKS